MPAIDTRDIDYKQKKTERERERAKCITCGYIDFPQSLPTIFLRNVFREPMKRDGRTDYRVATGIATFYFAASACRRQFAPRHYHRAVYN